MNKRDWNNITLKDWYEIQNILSVEDEYTTFKLDNNNVDSYVKVK